MGADGLAENTSNAPICPICLSKAKNWNSMKKGFIGRPCCVPYLCNSYSTLSYELRPLNGGCFRGTVGRSENPKGQAVIQGLLKVTYSILRRPQKHDEISNFF